MGKKILFIYTNYSTFVKTDFAILSSKHTVARYQFKPVKGLLKNAHQIFKQLIFILLNIRKLDAFFIWFADYHSFLPVLFAKIFGKKSYVIIGGYDVANIPELKYGSLSSPLRKWMTLFAFKNATLCLPVVNNLENQLSEVCSAAKIKTIYTGYQFNLKEQNQLSSEREKIILTVSITDSQQRMLIKGLDRFKELAENLPDYQFYIIGVNEDARAVFKPIPKNLILLAPLNQEELISYYLRASFYAQFSRSEGLPNALCEAMMYGCIPLGTNIGGIPMAIDNLGLVLKEWNYKEAIDFIHKSHNKLDRAKFSQHIKSNFDLKLREEALLELFDQNKN